MIFNNPPPIHPSLFNPPPLEEADELEFRPYLSPKMKPIFEKIREKILRSFELSKIIQAAPLREEFASIIKRIETLAFHTLMADEMTDLDRADFEVIQKELKKDLRALQKNLKKAIDTKDIDHTSGLQLQEEIDSTRQLMIELKGLERAIAYYQTISQTALKEEESFANQADQDPLAALPLLLAWVKTLSTLNQEALSPPKQLQHIGKPGLVKTQELHSLFLERVESEIESGLTDIEIEIKRHLKQLFYQIRHEDSSTKQDGIKQLISFHAYLSQGVRGVKVAHHHVCRKKNGVFSPFLCSLESLLENTIKQIETERIKKGLEWNTKNPIPYGSEEWLHLETQRPEVPPGLLSRAFSYLNPLEYLPEKWRPATEQVTKTFISALMLSQDIIGFANRLESYQALRLQANARREEIFKAVPEKTEKLINKERSVIGQTLTDKKKELLNPDPKKRTDLEAITKRSGVPQALPTLLKTRELLESGKITLSEETIEKIRNDHYAARMIEESPKISNPYQLRWEALKGNASAIKPEFLQKTAEDTLKATEPDFCPEREEFLDEVIKGNVSSLKSFNGKPIKISKSQVNDILSSQGLNFQVSKNLTTNPERSSSTILAHVLDATTTLSKLSSVPDTHHLQDRFTQHIRKRPFDHDSAVEIASWVAETQNLISIGQTYLQASEKLNKLTSIPDTDDLQRELNESIRTLPSEQTPYVDLMDTLRELVTAANDIINHNISFSISTPQENSIDPNLPCGVITPNLIKPVLPEIVKPSPIVEVRPREENVAFINAVIERLPPPPSDRVYANLVGLNTYEIRNATVNGIGIEGTQPTVIIQLFLESQQNYLEVLKEYPDYSTACRKELCDSIFSDPRLAELASKDENIMGQVLDQTQFALSQDRHFVEIGIRKIDIGILDTFLSLIGQSIGIVNQRRIEIYSSFLNQALRNKFTSLESGQSFFIPYAFAGRKEGHAVSLEIEKDPHGRAVFRIFNLGLGSEYNEFRAGKGLSFVEIVDIDPVRLFHGGALDFLTVMHSFHDFLEIWNPSALYQVFLGALGGKITNREDSSILLRDFQSVGNCPVASNAAALDKLYLSRALAEKMKALALYRSTAAYYRHHQSNIGYRTTLDEERSWLINIGARATLESIERAIEVGGFIGSEADKMVEEIKTILKETSALQQKSATEIVRTPFSLEGHTVWRSRRVQVTGVRSLASLKSLKGSFQTKEQAKYVTGATSRKVPELPDAFNPKDPLLADLMKSSVPREDLLAINEAHLFSDLKLSKFPQLEADLSEVRGIAAAQHAEDLIISENLALISKDPRHWLDLDRLQLLFNLVRQPSKLSVNLKRDPGLIQAFGAFFERGNKVAGLTQNAGIGGYFAYFNSILHETLMSLDPTIDTSHFPNSHALFQGLIDDCKDNGKERLKVLHYYQFKTFERKVSLTPQESVDLLASVSYLKAHDNSDIMEKEFHLHWDLVQIAQNILGNPETAKMALNAVAKAHHLAEANWFYDAKDHVFYNQDKSAFYDVTKGVLKSVVIGQQIPPAALNRHPFFLRIVTDPSISLERAEENVFMYKDQAGIHFRFAVVNQDVFIYRLFGSQWFQLIESPDTVLPPPILASLKTDGTLWASVDKESLLFIGNKHTPAISLKTKSGLSPTWIAELVELSPHDFSLKNTGAVLLDPTQSSLGKVLSRIEIPVHIFCFSKNKKLAHVSLPRLGLTFKSSENEQPLTSQELAGFGLSPQDLENPLFSDFAGYLPLQKIEASGKVTHGALIPNLSLKAHEKDVRLSTPTAFKPLEELNKKTPYFLYRLENNLLSPVANTKDESIQALIHLTGIYLSEKRYMDASKYLHEADRALKSLASKIDPEVANKLIEVAQFASVKPDLFPDAAAVRLQAASMVERLMSLDQIESGDQVGIQQINIHDDYQLYSQELHRVHAALRLSSEKSQLLFTLANRPRKDKKGEIVQHHVPTIPADLGFSIPRKIFSVTHSEKSITTRSQAVQMEASDFQLHPMWQYMSLQQVITHTGTPFVNAFPTDIVPMYKLLRSTQSLEDSERRKIARLFGFDETLSQKDLSSALLTLLELRYRFMNNQKGERLNHEWETENQKAANNEVLEAWAKEMSLVGALIHTGRNPLDKAILPLDEAAKTYHDVQESIDAAQFNLMPEYKEIIKTCEGYVREEALALWNLWVNPLSEPIPLSIEKTQKLTESFIGPILMEAPLEVSVQQNADRSTIRTGTETILPTRMPLFSAKEPLVPQGWIQAIFEIKETPASYSKSPFSIVPKGKFTRRLFREYDRHYSKYLKQQPATVKEYVLTDTALLNEQAQIFSKQIEEITTSEENLEKTLSSLLNMHSPNPSVKAHEQVNLAKGTRRELSIGDAKTAIAMGWNHNYLQRLNPNLNLPQIQQIFDLTLALMLQKREIQRRERIISAINQVSKASSTHPSWQFLLNNLVQALKEKMLYDPYETPVLLLAETEYKIALWEQQVPAIQRLAFQQQAAYLVELAMALGKTDIISPTMLPLLADGKSLPIYVMPDSLVSSMAPQLQNRAQAGFDMEIRTIPISHEGWTLEKIKAFKQELQTMRDHRIPLVWSSSDVQTFVNSYLQEMDADSNRDKDARARIAAWMDLFSFMRSSAIIIGDEIHALLDILTSYNLALGNAKPISEDEIDATSFLMKVIATHPALVDKVRLPFVKGSKGIPLTQEHFEQTHQSETLTPKQKIIETLMEQGITGEERAIELFRTLSPETKESVRQYLNALEGESYDVLEQATFFPTLDSQVLDDLHQERIKITDPKVTAVIDTLIPSDRAVALSHSKAHKLGAALKQIAETYQKLTRRIKNFLATLKESLRLVFVMTANAQIGKHYAMNLAKEEAIPSDNGTPLYDSQFGSTLERIFYTTFLVSQSKIPPDIIREDLNQFVEKYQLRIAEWAEENPELEDFDFQEDPLIKSFHARYGYSTQLNQRGFNDAELDVLTNYINSRIDLQMPFIRDYYLSKLTVYPKAVETTTHIFPSLVKPKVGLRGMTGTLYNRPTFPQVFSNTQLSDTIPKILERLRSASHPQTMTASLAGKPEEGLDDLFQNAEWGPGSIIDSTGYIQAEQTEQYARAMLTRINAANPTITSVAYYEGNTLMVVKIGVNQSMLFDSSIPRESLAALWDVAHTTGSNILINPNAHAFFYLGKHIRIFELAQSVMRLRSLGSGQRIVLVVAEEDRPEIIHQLNKHLSLQLADDHLLTQEEIIQYALLNEGLQESENNWRAIDMRMRMAIIEQILQHILWNHHVSPEIAKNAFDLVKSLFVKEHIQDPWIAYGAPILKQEIETATKIRLDNWLNHPVLKAIESNPQSFPNIDVQQIKERIEKIASEEAGPLQETVDSEQYLGKRQKVRTNTHVVATVKTKDKLKEHKKVKLLVKEKRVHKQGSRTPKPLRREPYPPLPVIPISSEVFRTSSYGTIPLKDLLQQSFDPIQSMHGSQTGVSLSDLLSLAPDVTKAVGTINRDISLSLNLAPLWSTQKGIQPLYMPYDYFSKSPSHALIVQDKKTNHIHLRLLDLSDALAYSEQLEADRQRPDNNNQEVYLSLYDLREDRTIASGSIPANPKQTPQINQHITALVSEAKFLSGYTRYTPEQKDFLFNWMDEAGRSPDQLLRVFVLKIALQQSHTLKSLEKTGLGKVFMKKGIHEEEIQKLASHTLVECASMIRKLLFDRTLFLNEWLTIFKQLTRKLKDQKAAHFMPLWSHIVTPLLPVIFDLPHRNLRNLRDLNSFQKRRLLMKAFFPNINDVYGAFKTAVPQMSGLKSGLPSFSEIKQAFYHTLVTDPLSQSMDPDASYMDPDASYLKDALTSQDLPKQPITVGVDQLETVSELVHPIWGLPVFTDSPDGEVYEVLKGWTISEDIKDLAETSHLELANKIALHAIHQLNVTASLNSLPSDYEFERLHGLFAFMTQHNLNTEARRTYALKMLPRLFADKFQDDTRFYTSFIPKSLTVDPQHYSEEEITNLLTRVYEEATLPMSTSEEAVNKRYYNNNDSTDFKPSRQELTLTLRAFAKDAPEKVATITAKWINNLLKSNPHYSVWLIHLIGQLWMREDRKALLDYEQIKEYLKKQLGDRLIVDLINLSYNFIDNWKIEDLHLLMNFQDLDLFADINRISMVNAPVLTIYDKARKWTEGFNKKVPANVTNYNPGQRLTYLWTQILGPILSEIKTNPPAKVEEKAILQNLLEVLDKVSAILQQNEFEEVQELLGNIRLAVHYGFDTETRKKEGLQLIKTILSKTPVQQKILAFFIPKFMIKESEIAHIKPEEILDILQHLQQTSLQNTPSSSSEYALLIQNFFTSIMTHGTEATKNVYINWLNQALQSGENNLLVDYLISAQLIQNPAKIEHSALMNYFTRNPEVQDTVLKHLIDRTSDENKSVFDNPNSLGNIYKFCANDFSLFADTSGLKTAGRQPLPVYDQVRKWTQALNKIVPVRTDHDNHNYDRLIFFWSQILGPIKSEISKNPFQTNEEKIVLRALIEAIDRISADIASYEFEEVHNLLGEVRLAAYYGFDLETRRKEGLQLIKTLPSQSSLKQKILWFFIDKFMIKKHQMYQLKAEEVLDLLQGLQHSSYNEENAGYFIDNFFNPLLGRSSEAAQEAFFIWINQVLQSGQNSKLFPLILLKQLRENIHKIQHSALLSYFNQNPEIQEKISIQILKRYHLFKNKKLFSSSDGMRHLHSFCQQDFALFAELSGLNTAGRAPLSHDELARRLLPLIVLTRDTHGLFETIFNALLDSVKAAPSIDKEAILKVLQRFDSEVGATLDDFEEPIASLTTLYLLVEFEDPNPSLNLKKALNQFINTKKGTNKEKYLKN